jgi:ABC-2 type transport system permease protein
MKKYLALIRSGIMEMLSYRMSFVIKIAGNLIYVIIIYYLWKAIFQSAGTQTVAGMTFPETMVYLVLASSLFAVMEVYLVWDTHNAVQSGKIINNLIKPVGYRTYHYFPYFGNMIMDFIVTFIPTFILVYFLSGGYFDLGINLLWFFVSIIIAIIINLSIDYFVSCIVLYTQSVWGINIVKETIVMLFGGAAIPIAFFPEPLKTIVSYMPFQAIYNAPLMQLLGDFTPQKRFEMLLVQLFWAVVVYIASELFWRRAVRVVTVNGG